VAISQRWFEEKEERTHVRPLGRPAAAIRVFIVDHHELLGEAFRAVLRADPALDVVGLESDAEQVPAQVSQTRPHVLLVRHYPPYVDGIALTTLVRLEFPELKVVLLAEFFSEQAIRTCIEVGAVGYLTLSRPPAELIHSIKRAHEGEVLFPADMLLQLLVRPRQAAEPARTALVAHVLGRREIEVLEALAAGATTAEIADRLTITVHTVRTHVKNIISKLGARSKLEAVLVAVKEGLITIPPD
jgi:DNA-binding NarL/FixJ family response regulator